MTIQIMPFDWIETFTFMIHLHLRGIHIPWRGNHSSLFFLCQIIMLFSHRLIEITMRCGFTGLKNVILFLKPAIRPEAKNLKAIYDFEGPAPIDKLLTATLIVPMALSCLISRLSPCLSWFLHPSSVWTAAKYAIWMAKNTQ